MIVALVGNQNSGKTTLFNTLTGTTQKVGNWPGVTIDRKEGIIKKTEHRLIDLPGIYSLSPYTSEEEISRNYVFDEKPDLIINIVDATSIERSLYLTTQLLELDCKVIIALNMQDRLEKKGIKIDVDKLSKELNTTIVSISALKKKGIEELIDAINKEDLTKSEPQKIFSETIEKQIAKVESEIESDHKRFVAVKLIENDILFEKFSTQNIKDGNKELEKILDIDTEQAIANERYNYITALKSKCVEQKSKSETITDKLDKVFLNKWAAIPIFVVIMFAIYVLSVGVVGTFTVDLVGGWFESLTGWFSGVLEGWGASPWSISLLCDGVIAGVGAVLGFVPQLIILFLCLCLLETTGYMSRIAFLLDRMFKKFGLSGKSLIPFICGIGCAVPAIMSCRTIKDQKEKDMTIILTPFVPCSAKLPIIAAFSSFFFSEFAGLIAASLYFFAIVIIILAALFLKKFVFKGKSSPFLFELPEYKVPSFKYVVTDVATKAWAFIKRAGTIILLCSVVLWFLISFSWSFEYGVDPNKSMLAGIGNAFAWLFYPMLGEWSWASTVSAVQGLVAKEQVISSMAVIAGLADDAAASSIFASSIFNFFTPASAYAYMVFNLFSVPCIGAVGALRKELGGWKKMWIAIALQLTIAFLASYLVFGIGSLISLI